MEILLSPARASWCKQTIELLVILHLALFYCLSRTIAEQTDYSMGRYRELLVKLIFSDLTSKQPVCQALDCSDHSDDVCYVFHMFRNSIFAWITHPRFSYCFVGLTVVGTSWPTCSSIASFLVVYKLSKWNWKVTDFLKRFF